MFIFGIYYSVIRCRITVLPAKAMSQRKYEEDDTIG